MSGNQWSNQANTASNNFQFAKTTSFCTLYFKLVKSDGSLVNFDSTTVFSIRQVDSTTITAVTATITNTGTGIYKVIFSTYGVSEGAYEVVLSGTVSGVPNKIVGVCQYYTPSATQYYASVLRRRLYDMDPSLYQIDEARKVLEQHIYDCLIMSVNDINFTGPSLTSFSLDTCPCYSLMLDGAYARLLDIILKLEIANTYTENEEPNVIVNRVSFYQTERDTWMRYYDEAKKSFKAAWRPVPVGMRSMQFPFMMTHIMGMMPGFYNVFA